MKRLLASLLALAMVLGVCLFAGCGKGGNDETTTNKTDGSTTTSATGGNNDGTTTGGNDGTETTTSNGGATESTTTEDTEETDPPFDGTNQLTGYEDIDFLEKKFVIAGFLDTADGFESDREVYSSDTDAIATAARERNQYIEQLYNCTIEFHGSETPGTLVAAEVTASKHTIDIYANKYSAASGATSGRNYNLYTLGIDFTQEWWDQNYVRQMTFKNSAGTDCMYSIVGDFSFSASNLAHALMFNKNLYETSVQQELGYDIYQLVRDGKWTMDVFAEMITVAKKEVSGNTEIKYSEGDILGWATTTHATHGLHAASGLAMFANNDGKLDMVMKADSAQWVTVMDKAIEMWNIVGRETTGYANGVAALLSGNTLFYSDIIAKLEQDDVKASSTAIGLVPYPKYSESQKNYGHYVDNHLMAYFVPTSVIEIEQLGDFFTIYAAHSTALVRPAWIDAYAYDFCGDADSAEMLDIILDSRTYDPGYLIFSNFEGSVSQQISAGKNNITKLIDKEYDRYVQDGGYIAEFIAGIDDNEA